MPILLKCFQRPKVLCSSAVTIHFVLANDFRIASSSNGLMVCMLITSAEIPFASNASAAISASQTKCPVADCYVSSFAKHIALPMTNGSSAGVKLALGRPNANKQDHDDHAKVAAFVWLITGIDYCHSR
jgi:uncharacterized membrane protein YozB (DUF420 family)